MNNSPFDKTKLTAVWGQDYDITTDSIYTRPVCPVCQESVFKTKNGNYQCVNCGDTVEISDPDMITWFREREKTKVEYEDCSMGCGSKGTFAVTYRINPVTLQWQVAYGRCKKCNMSLIV